MTPLAINSWMSQILDQLQHSSQRQLVVFQGPAIWCDSQLESLYSTDPAMTLISNRSEHANAIPLEAAETCLGGEARLVALDLFRGFNPDVFCIAAGLVRAGGLLLLFSPAPGDWDPDEDRYAAWQQSANSQSPLFVDYFFRLLEEDTDIGIFIRPDSGDLTLDSMTALQATPIIGGYTEEQAEVLRRLQAWLDKDHSGIALITAGRGRGKSTCLGMLVESLRSEGRIKVLVTAHSRHAASQLLQQTREMEFIAPDRLIEMSPGADLVVVDEAAMIPQSMLNRICRIYSRLIMSTTTGGYEGTGQGFLLRFVADLEQRKLLQLSLQQPVRWCPGDLLERWIDHSLMLNQAGMDAPVEETAKQSFELALMDKPLQQEQIPVIRQVYLLLASAHYRTRPSDLRMLMENPDLLLILAKIGDRVVGAVSLNREGGFDAELCREVFLGRRRPRGHLLAQMLTAQAGLPDFAGYQGLRVQRIAVAKAYRRRGIGAGMLERAYQFVRENRLDYLGASFALDPQTTLFWQRSGFEAVHVSFAAGKSSGNHSLAVLRPSGRELDAEIWQLQQRIRRQLATWMTQFLRSMELTHVVALLRVCAYRADTSDLEMQEIIAFARGRKGFELCFASLQKFVMQRIAQSDGEVDSLLVEKAVQNRSWENLERESASQGRRHLQTRLRGLVEALIKA